MIYIYIYITLILYIIRVNRTTSYMTVINELIQSKIFRMKDGSLDRFIEIKTTLAPMRLVKELKSIFGFVSVYM